MKKLVGFDKKDTEESEAPNRPPRLPKPVRKSPVNKPDADSENKPGVVLADGTVVDKLPSTSRRLFQEIRSSDSSYTTDYEVDNLLNSAGCKSAFIECLYCFKKK